jgi:hypothetical protein
VLLELESFATVLKRRRSSTHYGVKQTLYTPVAPMVAKLWQSTEIKLARKLMERA